MKLVSNCAQQCLKVGSVMGERYRSYLKTSLRVCSNCGEERAKFFFQLVFKFSHCFVEVMLGNKWVGICGITHSLDFLRNGLSNGGLCYPYRRLVGVRAVNTTTVMDEANLAPEDESRFVKPFGIHGGI